MTPERWAQVKAVFGVAQEKPVLERAAYLDATCGGDTMLRREVDHLLAQDEESLPSPAAGLLARSAPALAVGETLSHYRVEAKIGEGGMGAVYRAYDTELRRQVALKVLAPAYLADPKHKQGLMREARAASALSHPNIVAIYEVGFDGVDFIAMEFVEGKTFGELIPAKGLPLAKALDYAMQIASGLAKAHAAGVIHRDLKPGNIMLTAEGLVKLLDFGLARRVHVEQEESTQTLERYIAGTPAYMSPEQVEGRASDMRSDVFSFGVVLYRMLRGQPPFSGGSTPSILAAVLREDPPPLDTNVPRELQRIVARCLRKDPARRFQHMDDVKVELEELKGDVEAGKLASDLPPQRPSRWRWLPAVLAMLAGILVGGWLFSGPNIDVSRLQYTPVVTVMHQRRIEEAGGTGAFLPAWSPDGKSIVYSDDGLRVQRVESPESLRLTDQGWHPFFSADGTRIYYVTSGQTSRELWSVSVAGGTPERVLPDLGGGTPLGGAAMSRDGKALVVLRPRKTGDPEMSVWISSPPGAPPRPYPGSPGGRTLSRAWFHFSPDGSKLLLTLARALVGADRPVEWWLLQWPPPATEQAGAVRRIFEDGPRGWFHFTGDWLLDNRHVVVSVPRDGEVGGPLWIADTVKGTWRRVTPGLVAHDPPRVSREGRVVFDIVKEEENAIEIPLDGSAIRPVFAGFRQERYPAWSPVGEHLLFVTNERGEPEIWLASRKEGPQRPLVTQRDFPPGEGLRQFVSPQFSPDGTRIVYASKGAIWVSPVAGGPPVRICEGQSATWSPDGASLAVGTGWFGANALIKVPVSRPQDAVTIHRAADWWLPRWSPDGKWITIQLPEGFGVVSPDGARSKVLRKGMLDWGAACGWSREGSTLYLAYLTPQGRVLSAFDVDSGAERRVRDLGSLHFSYFTPNSTGLSPSPDGKSLAASTWSLRFEPWILDGLEPPRTFLGRLLRPW